MALFQGGLCSLTTRGCWKHRGCIQLWEVDRDRGHTPTQVAESSMSREGWELALDFAESPVEESQESDSWRLGEQRCGAGVPGAGGPGAGVEPEAQRWVWPALLVLLLRGLTLSWHPCAARAQLCTHPEPSWV
ncbi:hypothetical protein P7K49_002037 [Saguinus oedipus]|uniref:Uncharacterized protein n=1 Tax=Saguinus oedipus TaxID=9490 RepID=A0ABQ9WH54_SAGOE|nr:hypothetical protein P7K49_002037 [Saguinus oedipus]